MEKLKRVLAGALSLCMVGSMLTACGDSSSSSSNSKSGSSSSKTDASSTADSSTGDSSTTEESSSKAENPDRKNTAEIHGKESSQESKDTVRIYCWNTEFKLRLDKFYPKYTKLKVETGTYKDEKGNELTEIKTIDGKKVEWVQNTNDGGVYQTKLDEALKAQPESDTKVDIFLMEADYAMKYTDGGVALSVQDLGITDDDTKEMYQYTLDAATSSKDGEVKGLSWQATPGLFYYNADKAKEVLGSDDPAEVQKAVADWDKFKETAEKMKAKGYKMLSSYADTYRVFTSNVSAPWVTDKKLSIDPQIETWIKYTKEWSDAGYINGTDQWSQAWQNDQKADSKVFGFFYPSWGLPNCLASYSGDAGKGKWRGCQGPTSWYWGGTWICGAIDSDNQDIVADIMKVMTCDKECAKDITTVEQDYTNNKAGIKELIDGGYKNDFLGGQNHLALMTENAEKISLKGKISPYDQFCVEGMQGAMGEYFKGEATYEAALEKFKTDLKKKVADIEV